MNRDDPPTVVDLRHPHQYLIAEPETAVIHYVYDSQGSKIPRRPLRNPSGK